MQLKSILNRVQKHQGFVYTDMDLTQEKEQLVLNVTLRPRTNGRALCSGCGRKRPGYDTLPTRRFEFIPFWGILVYFVYAMRRVACPTCGIKVERVPWAEDHPWRMTSTIDQKIAARDGQWHHVQIPLRGFVGRGSWDNNTWLLPQGLFDWSAVNRFEIVSEDHDLVGMQFWFDDIRITKPPGGR